MSQKTKHYDSPGAFKQGLKDRLRAHIKTNGLPPTELDRYLRLIAFERFLARIDREILILKGGFAIELRSKQARTTLDVDVCLKASADEILQLLRVSGRRDLGDFFSFDVEPNKHSTIDAEGLRYQGQRFKVTPKLGGKDFTKPFKMDVALFEADFGEPEPIRGTERLSFAGIEPPHFLAYSIESHLAEKLHAYTLPRKMKNSRVKDLPDVALLASLRKIDGSMLRAAFEKTFSHRNTHPLPETTPDPPDLPGPPDWEKEYAKTAQKDRLPWPDLDTLMGKVKTFLNPVLANRATTWNPEAWQWE